MLSAKNEQGQLITLVTLSKQAISHLRKYESFYCPACNDKVIIKAGKVMIPHFAHQTKINCNLLQAGEGDYHYKGKLLLYEWLKKQQLDVSLEYYLSDIKQRPDILLKINNKVIAIEFQCAKIETNLIYERNQGYKKVNIIPIWILGANLFKRKSTYHLHTNQFISSMVHRFSYNHPTTLFYFCPQQKQLSIVQDIIPTTTNTVIAKQTYLPLEQAIFSHLFMKQFFTKVELYTLWKNELKTFRLQKRSNYGKERAWRNWLYTRGLHLDYVATHIFLPIRSQYKMKVPLWYWQSKFILDYLNEKPLHALIPLQQVESFLHSFKQSRIDQQLIRTNDCPIKEYIQLLCEMGFLKEVNEGIFIKVKSIMHYNHIEKALIGDHDVLDEFMYN